MASLQIMFEFPCRLLKVFIIRVVQVEFRGEAIVELCKQSLALALQSHSISATHQKARRDQKGRSRENDCHDLFVLSVQQKVPYPCQEVDAS